jgi:hypothetical protein
MLTSGDYEMMLPLFRMCLEVLPLRKAATQTYFGHHGRILYSPSQSLETYFEKAKQLMQRFKHRSSVPISRACRRPRAITGSDPAAGLQIRCLRLRPWPSQLQVERPVLGPVLAQPAQGFGGEHVRVVTLERAALPVDVQHRIEIFTLPGEPDPMIKARPRTAVVVPHVPFADRGGGDAGALQVLRKENRPRRLRSLVVHDAMPVHLLAGQDRGAHGGTERGGDEGVGEMGALRRQRQGSRMVLGIGFKSMVL